jgi:hypothetical protein
MKSSLIVALCLSFAITSARASAQPANSVTERIYPNGGFVPSRTVERRSESGGRQIVVATDEIAGVNGRWEPVEEVVMETVRTGVASETRRQVFRFDAERRRMLIEITEARETLDGAIVRIVEETRIPDINGGSGLTSRWTEERRTVGGDSQQVDAILLTRGVNGLRETERTTQIERRTTPATLRREGTHLVRDPNGRWIPFEARTVEIRETPEERIEEETIRRPDLNGYLTVTDKMVTRRSEVKGQEQLVVETYSPIADGFFRPGSRLELTERIRRSTTATTDGGRSTVEEVEARNRVAPSDPMRVVQRTVTTVSPDRQVTQRHVFERDLNGRLTPVMWETEEAAAK